VITDPSRQTSLGMGDRLGRFEWALSYLDATKRLFLSNFASPHLLACLDLDGSAEWCSYLNPGCCGGDPVYLPNGSLVVSSGCGGVLTWLDLAGRIIKQSKPHEGVGLATAFSSRVRGLSDSSSIVDGGPGVLSYAPDASVRWHVKDDCSCFDYDGQHALLVTASWRDVENRKTVTVRCTKTHGGRSAMA
jgi:hypothetical protein